MVKQEPRRRTRAASRPLDAALEQRWAAYALAAAAGLGATAQPALAKIVYTPPPHHIIGPYGSLPIDFTGGENYQFSMRCLYSSLFGFASLNLYRGERFSGQASVIGRRNGVTKSAAALSSGAEIGPGANFLTLGAARMVFNHTSSTGRWTHAQHRYLGLRFTIGENTYYGWAEFSVHLGTPHHNYWILAKPEGYAFETTPNQPIAAGAGKPLAASAIQPATLGLLAVGAPALTYWRRKESPVEHESAN